MKSRSSIAAAVLLAASATHVLAAPLALNGVSSDAKWVVHADVNAIRSSELGKHLLDKMGTEQAEKGFAALQAVLHFDPRTDLDGATLYGFGDGKQDGSMILRGRFDGQQLITLLAANESYTSSSHSGHRVHSWIDEKKAARAERTGNAAKRSQVCVYANDLLVFSDVAGQVERVVDVLDGRSPSAAQATSLPGLANIPGNCLFIAAANTAAMQNLDPKAAMLQNTDSAALTISEAANTLRAALNLETGNEEAALNLSKMADGMIGMALINAAANPAAAELAESAGVKLNGKSLTISLDLPVADWIKKIDTWQDKDDSGL